MNESLNKKDVMASLSGIQITERGNRRVGNKYLLTLMPVPECLLPLTLPGVDCCSHITFVTSNQFWVNDDKNNLIFSNTASKILHQVDDGLSKSDSLTVYGSHTVNSYGEIIYMNSKLKINKLSMGMKTMNPFIETTDYIWKPRCI